MITRLGFLRSSSSGEDEYGECILGVIDIGVSMGDIAMSRGL
jgi:hypothetical protein